MAHFYLVKNYELIEHTADIGIRVRGKDLRELFENAARAMFDIIAEKKPQVAGRKSQVKKIIIKQKAENLEELFVNWLNELLSLSAVKELIFEDFNIKKIDENNIEASATGSSVDNYRVNTEIKAATYHELKLEQTKAGCLAEVIFDV
jgi:SHS2 domain-containing protein